MFSGTGIKKWRFSPHCNNLKVVNLPDVMLDTRIFREIMGVTVTASRNVKHTMSQFADDSTNFVRAGIERNCKFT